MGRRRRQIGRARGTLGPMRPRDVWARWDAMEARLSAPLSDRMLALLGAAPHHRVLDLATGRGEPAIHACRAVAQVVGTDRDASMLELARERAEREGITNLTLHATDAETLAGIEGPFDGALCRWGLMYFGDPLGALRRARALVAGPLVLAVWARPERATFFTLPRALLSPFRPLPEDRSGTFRFAGPSALSAALTETGWSVAHEEELEVDVVEAASDDGLLEWVRTFGLGRLLEGLPDAEVAAWEASLLAHVPPGPGGLRRLGGVSRIVVAR